MSSAASSQQQQPILIVDDEQNIRFVLRQLLSAEGFEVEESIDGADAVERVRKRRYAIVVMDIRMPRMDGLTALRRMREIDPNLIVLIITAHGTNKTALEALQNGAYDYFTKPFDLTEVRVVVRRAVEKITLLRQLEEVRAAIGPGLKFENLIGNSPAMEEVFALIRRVVDNDVTVLITGESGTGKEVVASAIHHHGPRRTGPFIKVNTVAIPDTLLESELFGHERGAFTGAVQQKIGKVEAAHGGTLFLDEIGDMAGPLQAKLLRVLQEREVERVGSTKTVKVDIRVICATNRDLVRAVEKNEFREDLFYRINVLPIHLPPLRKRRDDIPALIDHFIQLYNVRLKRSIRGITTSALQRFLAYNWPGNIRELENALQRTMLMCLTDRIDLSDLPPTLRGEATPSPRTPLPVAGGGPQPEELHEALADIDFKQLLEIDSEEPAQPLAERLAQISDQVEKYLIRAALKKKNGHRQETADLLGISRKSLHNKMVRYGLFDEDDDPNESRSRRELSP